MCFSATASFTASGLLLGVGLLSGRAVRHRSERAFAAIPLLFAAQQGIEGLVWWSFSHQAQHLNVLMTYAYATFSHLLWPLFVPLSVLWLEPEGWRRSALRVCVAAGGLVSLGLLYSLLSHGIESRQVGQHIEYLARPLHAETILLLYLLATSLSMTLSSHAVVKAFGLLVALSFAVAYGFYAIWFISVWCYFAALLSTLVLLHLGARRTAWATR